MGEWIDYYGQYADLYDRQFPGQPDDLAFYESLAEEADGLIIELGVGTGRLAIPPASGGATVVGVDPFAAMLRIARRKAADAGVLARVALVQGDMRSFARARSAALVTIPARRSCTS
jgi:predicted RNA methylase